jgi:large subunit ribosomal protein L24
VDEDKHAVAIKDLNMMDIYIPDWAKQDPAQRTVSAQPRHLPAEHVKLVYPLPDPKTGMPRDVVIERLEKVQLEPTRADYERDPEPRKEFRAIPGVRTIIPWPDVPADQEDEDNPDDTPRITVDEVTFRPYLLYPPMPTSVIDELRNKYSKFRTRHTWEYEQKLEAEEQREERRSQLGKTMRTPLQELAELRARQKAAEERELTEEHLAKIGEVMAGEREKIKSAVARR